MSMCPLLHTYYNDYAYALYNKYINIIFEEIAQNEDLFYSIAKDILDLTKQERYSPYEATVNKMIRYEASKTPVNYERYLELLNLLDPALLSKDELKFKDGKTGESPLERWYRQMVKVTFELGQYEECIENVNKALASIQKFHYRNLSNLKYYRGKAYVKLERYDDAQREFLSLQGRVRDVNFYEVLYKTYSGLNEDKKANAYLIYDLYNNGYNIDMVPMYSNLKEASDKAGYEKLSGKLETMIATMVKEKETKTDLGSGDLYDDMIDELTDHLDKLVDRQQGKVIYYNNEKELGNILTPNEGRLFFRQADYIYNEEDKKYDVVENTVLPTYDRKKEAVSSKAVLITLLYED